ncbi:uncharacterized protein LACBIDRAFT_296725 [Laccaria bicolor S238N-H82]|uniref:Predicted protein n=1 Tax=Laccaria bicolor (strain S238N-H82 / ATCC MYA-4686) TaxID=486041 RepID=B0D857_LACBS|nr:uncharacterized protein LACBIDRAFT_296725 [Laccaria bicolor S238N-H82]EDR09020.1 predicted protein [Laccaria bicolor S238N-H82]|eukprot:XP_001880333.1 predicted protein [Laccaria bicolor S238N-H82]
MPVEAFGFLILRTILTLDCYVDRGSPFCDKSRAFLDEVQQWGACASESSSFEPLPSTSLFRLVLNATGPGLMHHGLLSSNNSHTYHSLYPFHVVRQSDIIPT